MGDPLYKNVARCYTFVLWSDAWCDEIMGDS